MELTGGDGLAQQLVAEGVTQVFGVPGVQLDFATDAFTRVADRLQFWTTRHEQATAYMADGYARTTGGVGVCMVVPGPGLLNAMAALSTAYACSSRVLCIAGQIPSRGIGQGLGMLHEVRDQSHTLGTVTKWHALARTPEEIPGLVHEAMRQLHSGRPQPVAIEVPQDVFAASAEMSVVTGGPAAEPVVGDNAQLARAAELLAGAQRPVIYVGGGVLAGAASEQLRELAESLQAPVVMSANGRGALDSRHPLALNSLSGRDVLPDADVVLVVGSRFIQVMGAQVVVAPGASVILLNADAADLGGPRSSVLAIHADAALGLAAISGHLGEHRPPESRAAELDAVRRHGQEQMEEIAPQWGWVQALRAGIPEDGVLVSGLTQVGYLANVAYPVYGPNTYVTPGYQGTLGYSFATALGAKAARPDRTVVSICGDGGFGWNMQELATARRYNIGLVTVVFNDNAFGNVRRIQQVQFGGRYIATDLVNPDYLKLADAFGVAGARVESPDQLRGVLQDAQSINEPLLVEVPVGPMPSAWHLIVDHIKKPASTT